VEDRPADVVVSGSPGATRTRPALVEAGDQLDQLLEERQSKLPHHQGVPSALEVGF